ncbi:PD40 domain-containing protein [candidate division KSB1 bacterium]|nr:PD40 domain-containing protein [candidate division KSB1 bacterium]
MKSFFKTIWRVRIFSIFILLYFSGCKETSVESYTEVDTPAKIDPDYSEILIPPNIAPLNFKICENGMEFLVHMRAGRNHINIFSKRNTIKIPARRWKRLLQSNRGGRIDIDIYIKNSQNQWKKYRKMQNQIALQEIDSFVVYRLIHPGYTLWWEMGLYQRNIENFSESPIFTNRVAKRNCMNCHSFCKNNPQKMLFHMRAGYSGTIFVNDDDVRKINTGTDYTMSAGVYPSWHPDGKHVAFSVNMIYQQFHAHQDKNILVKDTASDIIVYNIETNTITTSPKVSTKRLENLPVWSADGRYIYFCSGPPFDEKMDYRDVKYDLMRIAYDTETNAWGNVEPVLSASETGKSISFPKISPDGRYLMFCMSDYGYFTIHFTSSDLYLMDLTNNNYRKMKVNSDHVESYHSWSSGGRWFVFCSKKRDGLCSRLYFSYLDDSGNTSKPVLLPQEDPQFYDTFIKNYNVPELITGPVTTEHWKLAQATLKEPMQASFDKSVDIDGLSGATRIVKQINEATQKPVDY